MTDKNIDRLDRLHETIVETAPGISSEEYRAFLYIANNEGVCQRDIQEHFRLPQSTTSRTVAALNGPGHGLIESEMDPKSRRRRNLRLSPRGRALIAQLTLLLGCFIMASTVLSDRAANPRGMLSTFTGEHGAWDFTGHDRDGHYDACYDIRTFRCDRT